MQKPSDNPDSVPMPIVLIDQDSDSEATIVQLSFGDRLGALLDTVIFADGNLIMQSVKCFKPVGSL